MLGRVLDVGCGLGWLLSAMNDNWNKSGLEISAYAATQAFKHGDIFVGELRDACYCTLLQ